MRVRQLYVTIILWPILLQIHLNLNPKLIILHKCMIHIPSLKKVMQFYQNVAQPIFYFNYLFHRVPYQLNALKLYQLYHFRSKMVLFLTFVSELLFWSLVINTLLHLNLNVQEICSWMVINDLSILHILFIFFLFIQLIKAIAV